MVESNYMPQQGAHPYAQGAPVAAPVPPGQPTAMVPSLSYQGSMNYQAQPQVLYVTVPAKTVQPIPGYRIMPPKVPPQSGQVVVAWQIEEGRGGLCKCDTLSDTGWIIIIILILLFPLAAPIVCCLSPCHQTTQSPVYGWAGAHAEGMYVQPGVQPYAQPAAQEGGLRVRADDVVDMADMARSYQQEQQQEEEEQAAEQEVYEEATYEEATYEEEDEL